MHFIKNISSGILLLLIISDLSSANLRLCGQSLTQFLEVACVDGFNSKNLKAKKSDPLFSLNENVPQNSSQPSEFSALFKYANHNSLLTKTRRRRHDGVADECCRKHCSMPELLSYCI